MLRYMGRGAEYRVAVDVDNGVSRVSPRYVTHMPSSESHIISGPVAQSLPDEHVTIVARISESNICIDGSQFEATRESITRHSGQNNLKLSPSLYENLVHASACSLGIASTICAISSYPVSVCAGEILLARCIMGSVGSCCLIINKEEQLCPTPGLNQGACCFVPEYLVVGIMSVSMSKLSGLLGQCASLISQDVQINHETEVQLQHLEEVFAVDDIRT